MSSKTGIFAAKAQQYELMGRVGGQGHAAGQMAGER